MKIKFYGTAAAEGVPALYCDCDTCEQARKLGGKEFRTRSQSLVNDDLLIDFPADTYMHVLRDGLPLHKIYNIIITHAHSDHLYPVDIGMRMPGYAHLKDDRPLNVYGSSTVAKVVRTYPLNKRMEEQGILKIHEINAFEPFCVDGYNITPLAADHNSAENPLIYLIEKDGKTLLYAHDTGLLPDETMEYLKKRKPHIDFATFDCCFSLVHNEIGHMGLDEVYVMTERLKAIGTMDENTVCCINHFSHNNGLMYEDMATHASKYGFLTSFDGMEVEF